MVKSGWEQRLDDVLPPQGSVIAGYSSERASHESTKWAAKADSGSVLIGRSTASSRTVPSAERATTSLFDESEQLENFAVIFLLNLSRERELFRSAK
jgi:hypothetical protein